MDPDGYTPEQRQLQRTVRDFARRELAPGARERDRTGQFDYALYRRLGDLGLPGMTFPAELGGGGADTLSFCLAIDEVSRVDLSIGLTLWVGIQGGQTLLRSAQHGHPEWLDDYVRPIVRGEMVGAGAITEPDAGSDTAAIRTRAVLDGDEWVINGAKIYISNAGMENCAFVTPLCRTDEGFALFLVPRGTPGYHISPPLQKMGLRSADTRELSFDNCRVPAGHVLGGRGSGRAAVVGSGFALTRIYIASNGVGLAAKWLRLATERGPA